MIAGRKSSYCTLPGQLEAIEALFPAAAERDAHFLDCGHWVHAEKANEFVALVDAFCAEGEAP